MKKQTLLLCITALLVAGCCSQPKEDKPLPTKPDPAIEAQARKEYRQYKQSFKRMRKTLQVPAIHYDFDSVRPPDYAYGVLDKVAALMLENPFLHLMLEGNSDVIDSDEYNYWIGASRAAALKSYLVSRGINAERIFIKSYGRDHPVTYDTSEKGRRANRRVEFTFTKREWKSIY